VRKTNQKHPKGSWRWKDQHVSPPYLHTSSQSESLKAVTQTEEENEHPSEKKAANNKTLVTVESIHH
jgi:hypothetical protein